MTVYIPSYFNNLEERYKLFNLCIDSYLTLGFNIVVVWMNEGFEKRKHKRITYIDSEPKNASKARNQLLALFYKTNDTYCYLSDDDTQLLQEIEDIDDCISIVNDRRLPLSNTTNISSALLKLRNFNKYYNKKLYFDEELNANQDYDFARLVLSNGLTTRIVNTKYVVVNRAISSMFSSPQNKLYRKQESLKIINNKTYDT